MKTTYSQLRILTALGLILGIGAWAYTKAHEQPEPVVTWNWL